MSTLVILVHPNIEESVVNKKWRDALLSENIDVHELYLKYPNGELNIKEEQDLLESYDNIIFQYPLYWYSSPSLLKKYLDEVFEYGWAYGSTGNALNNKNIGLAVSIGADSDKYESENATRFSTDTLLSPMMATADFVGAKFVGIHKLYGALNLTQEKLEENVKAYIANIRELEESN
ncbi:NAD(P)H-dependent oxidoreductase [Mammaliicoccus sp. Dog046]|uniref:NAD(P)H-dependent oxidoreductase n=1 Tax=Mammaliicoccus sp. Dog046 TaxID=3034233 RepID=UPI002B2580AE|nr:NAD(P)H-dependent oxidoreductase [Mammaliicoccus sp. Dog046]WQK84648.1 NAD(P)H-dependent oxidoreductase [Mammaliicoccus sp. Dog046]